MTNFPILSSLILIPTIGSIFLLFIKSTEKNNSIKYVALFTSLINFFYLFTYGNYSTIIFQTFSL